MTAPIKGILWDFDGTLASTQPILQQALIDILKSLYPVPTHGLDLSITKDWWGGKSNTIIFQEVEQRYNLTLPKDIQELFLKQAQIRLSRDPLQWADDAIEPLLKSLSQKFAMAVASNGEHAIVHGNVAKLNAHGIFPSARIHTIRDVAPGRGKPFPDLFNTAAAALNLKPENCLVVGDSFADLGAARAAGMQFIAYVGCHSDQNAAIKSMQDDGATTIIRHYRDFPKI